jgi:hypothetical protein
MDHLLSKEFLQKLTKICRFLVKQTDVSYHILGYQINRTKRIQRIEKPPEGLAKADRRAVFC